MMRELAVRVAKRIYRSTPWMPVRRFYFMAFYYLVRHRNVVASLGSLTFSLNLGELIDLDLYLGEYERDVDAALAANCRPGDVVFDIGANVGAHTLRLAEMTGGVGRVYAFEPTEYAYGKLVRNLSLNPQLQNVTPSRVILSDHNAENQDCEIRATWRPDGRHSIYPTRVDFIRLDDWCQQQGVQQVDLIKLDVDGHEAAVLAGGVNLLEQCRPAIVMEAGSYHFVGTGNNPLTFLLERGYFFSDLTGSGPMDLGGIERACASRDSVNILARAPRNG